MKKIEALNEAMKMWVWLYRHPAQDRKYYMTYVAKLDTPWKNDCPLCEISENNCASCLMQTETDKGTFCTDPESPFSKWQTTSLDNPDYRTLYAGEIAAITKNKADALMASA